MMAFIIVALNLTAALFKSKSRPEAESATLRWQLIVPQQGAGLVSTLLSRHRQFFIQLYR